jgi:hypothetical protein
MKLSILLNENDGDSAYDKGRAEEDAIIKKELSQCIPFLKKYRDDMILHEAFILRGIRERQLNVMVKNTHGSRSPRDSSETLHKNIDHMLEKHIGHRFRSDHIAFCKVGIEHEPSNVTDYGQVFRIFPIGTDYKFCYSTVVDDFYDNYDNRLLMKVIEKSPAAKKDAVDFFTTEFELAVKKIIKDSKKFVFDPALLVEHVANIADDYFTDYFDSTHRSFKGLQGTDFIKHVEGVPYDMEEHAIFSKKLENVMFHAGLSSLKMKEKFVDIMFKHLCYKDKLDDLGDAYIESAHKNRIVELMMYCTSYVAVSRSVEFERLQKIIRELVNEG